jgi:hypothetical protein
LAAKFRFGHGHTLPMPFVLSRPAEVTVTVMRGNRVVAKMSTAPRNAGRGRLTWNGKTNGKFAARGIYRIVARAISPTDGSASDVATLWIT